MLVSCLLATFFGGDTQRHRGVGWGDGVAAQKTCFVRSGGVLHHRGAVYVWRGADPGAPSCACCDLRCKDLDILCKLLGKRILTDFILFSFSPDPGCQGGPYDALFFDPSRQKGRRGGTQAKGQRGQDDAFLFYPCGISLQQAEQLKPLLLTTDAGHPILRGPAVALRARKSHARIHPATAVTFLMCFVVAGRAIAVNQRCGVAPRQST